MNKNIFWASVVVLVVVAAYWFGSQSGNNSSQPTPTLQSAQSTTPQQILENTPQQVAQNSDDLQFKCAQLGATAKSAYEAKNPDISQVILTNAVFHYDTRLRKCFFGRELHFRNQDNSGSVWKGITDLYSNNDVLYTWIIYTADDKRVGDFSAINYIGYPNEQGGGVIKSEVEFEALYNKTLTE